MKLPTKHCLPPFFPSGLDFKELQMGVSLSGPPRPKARLQTLPTTLRSNPLKPIPSCSKASGVFSSRCRYPASSRESHFHRARRRDSLPIVTPFVRSGTSSVCYANRGLTRILNSTLIYADTCNFLFRKDRTISSPFDFAQGACV